MNSQPINITVDALGADDAPSVVLDGVSKALQIDKNLTVDLCGPADVVQPFAENHDRCNALLATEEISMSEHPAKAVRKKKDSSIVVSCNNVKSGKSDGFFSAGNTGACLAAATLYIGRIKGIKRPMLACLLPNAKDTKTLFCDVGANADCKPEYLAQFGQMARAYLKATTGSCRPKIGLLNIGEEDTKGSIFSQNCNKEMKEAVAGFAGNAEGRDILSGDFDAIITDGFSGNIVLKNMEGTFKFVFKKLKNVFYQSLKTKLAALVLKPALKGMITQVNPDEIGAAMLVGVTGAVTVGHGSSNTKAICSGILRTAEIARANVVEEIQKELQ